MKKLLLSLSLLSLVLFGLVACNNKQTTETNPNHLESPEDKGEKLRVVTTIFPQYDFARNVGKDLIDVEMLIRPGLDIHYFEPSPRDILTIEGADLFIYLGGADEKWVDMALENMDNKPETIRLMDLVDLYEEEIVEGMEDGHNHEDHDHEEVHEDHDHEEAHEDHDHEEAHEDHDHEETHEDHDHNHGSEDEHLWTSLRNAQIITGEIAHKLADLDPDNKEIYEANMATYKEDLDKLDQKFIDLFASRDQKILIFGDRFPFRYFVEDYDLEYYAAFPGCSTEVEPSPKTVAFLIDKAKDNQVKTIFKIENSKGQMAQSISEAIGGQVKTLHSAHNLTQEEMDQGLGYLEIMEENLKVLGGE